MHTLATNSLFSQAIARGRKIEFPPPLTDELMDAAAAAAATATATASAAVGEGREGERARERA